MKTGDKNCEGCSMTEMCKDREDTFPVEVHAASGSDVCSAIHKCHGVPLIFAHPPAYTHNLSQSPRAKPQGMSKDGAT